MDLASRVPHRGQKRSRDEGDESGDTPGEQEKDDYKDKQAAAIPMRIPPTMSTCETQQTGIAEESISPRLARMREKAWEEAKAKIKSDGLYGAYDYSVDASDSSEQMLSVLDVVDLEDFFRKLDAAVDV